MGLVIPEIPDESARTHPDIKDDTPWFAAQLKPNGYAKAKHNLERQGYKTFMPLLERVVSHARTKRRVMRPLFPGYIFITFDPGRTQWRSINNTFGVSSLIMARTNTPARVPDSLMTALLTRCDVSGHILPPEKFNAGDKVRIIGGAFEGTLAKVQHASEGERVRLLLDIMGRSVSTDCAQGELEILRA